MRTEYEEDCEQDEGEEKCHTEFDYVCEEAKPKYKPTTYAPPSTGYGVPGAPVISGPTPRGGTGELPQYRYIHNVT